MTSGSDEQRISYIIGELHKWLMVSSWMLVLTVLLVLVFLIAGTWQGTELRKEALVVLLTVAFASLVMSFWCHWLVRRGRLLRLSLADRFERGSYTSSEEFEDTRDLIRQFDGVSQPIWGWTTQIGVPLLCVFLGFAWTAIQFAIVRSNYIEKEWNNFQKQTFLPLEASVDRRVLVVETAIAEIKSIRSELSTDVLGINRELDGIRSSATAAQAAIETIRDGMKPLRDLEPSVRRLDELVRNAGLNNKTIAEIVTSDARFATAIADRPPIGSVVAFAGMKDKIPAGWLACDGRVLGQEDYYQLFEVIGQSYAKHNEIDELTTSNRFRAPDLRGVFLRGVNDQRTDVFADSDAGQRLDPGGSTRIGDLVGSMQTDEFKRHRHHVHLEGGQHDHGVYDVARYDFGGDTDNDPNGARPLRIRVEGPTRGAHTHEGNTEEFGGMETRPRNAAVYWIIKAKPAGEKG